MKKGKAIRKIAYIVMALMLVISTVFTGVGTMGVMEAKADDSRQLITKLKINMDWSKVPSLTTGTAIGEEATDLPEIKDGPITVDSSEEPSKVKEGVLYGWAVQLKPEFVEKGYLSQEEYDMYANNFNCVAPLNKLDKEYKISDSDEYYFGANIEAEYQYKFGDGLGEDISNIVECNISNYNAYTDGRYGQYILLYLRLGTSSEIENKKNGYEFDSSTGTLTITSNAGTTAWQNNAALKDNKSAVK